MQTNTLTFSSSYHWFNYSPGIVCIHIHAKWFMQFLTTIKQLIPCICWFFILTGTNIAKFQSFFLTFLHAWISIEIFIIAETHLAPQIQGKHLCMLPNVDEIEPLIQQWGARSGSVTHPLHVQSDQKLIACKMTRDASFTAHSFTFTFLFKPIISWI